MAHLQLVCLDLTLQQQDSRATMVVLGVRLVEQVVVLLEQVGWAARTFCGSACPPPPQRGRRFHGACPGGGEQEKVAKSVPSDEGSRVNERATRGRKGIRWEGGRELGGPWGGWVAGRRSRAGRGPSWARGVPLCAAGGGGGGGVRRGSEQQVG